MRIRALRKQDLRSVNRWLAYNGVTARRWSDFPARAFIVPGVAIACLRDCEGGYAMFDSLATNPYVSSATRHKASIALWNKILNTETFHTIIGLTGDAGTLERALRHGFKVVNQSVLVHSQEAE